MTAALAPPAERLRAALAESASRTDRILAGEPTVRSEHYLAGEIFEKVKDAQRARQAFARQALAEAETARQAVGVVGRMARAVGFRTAAVRRAAEAEDQAMYAELDAQEGGQDLPDASRRADIQARALVKGDRRQLEAWRARPDVVAANHERHGNHLIAKAVHAGDSGIARLAADDLPRARAIVLARKKAAASWAAERAAADRQREPANRMRGYQGGPGLPGRR